MKIYLKFKKNNEIYYARFNKCKNSLNVKVYKNFTVFKKNFKFYAKEYSAKKLSISNNLNVNTGDYFMKLSEAAVDTYIAEKNKKFK